MTDKLKALREVVSEATEAGYVADEADYYGSGGRPGPRERFQETFDPNLVSALLDVAQAAERNLKEPNEAEVMGALDNLYNQIPEPKED